MAADSRPTNLALFLTFATISLQGFGGAIPWAQRKIVDEQHWMTTAEYANSLALCQFIPGANIINLAVLVGARFGGPLGALASVGGLLLPAFVIVTLAGTLYDRVGSNATVRNAIEGIAASAAGLLAAMLIRLCVAAVRAYSWEAIPLAIVSFAALTFLHVPLPLALLVLAPVAIAFAWWRMAR